MKIKNKSRKPSGTKLSLKSFSRRYSFVLIPVIAIVFCLVGVGTMVETPAATSPSVRFILFCGKDSSHCKGDTVTIRDRGYAVRSWYKSKLGGQSFRMLKTKKVIGIHNASFYNDPASLNGTYYTDPAAATWVNISKEPALQEANVKYVVALGFGYQSMSHCGVGAAGNMAVYDSYRRGCSAWIKQGYAHELGHAFNIAAGSGADSLDHRSDGSVMHSPLACNGGSLKGCFLNSNDRSYLLNSRSSWFTSATASTATLDPDEEPMVDGNQDDPTWSPWKSVAGPNTTISSPASAVMNSGRVDQVIRGTDSVIYHRWYVNGQWSAWQSLGGWQTPSAPALTSWEDGRLDLVIRGMNNGIYHRVFANNQWYPWEDIGSGGATIDAPSVTSWQQGRLDVVVRGTDSMVYHKWFSKGQWSAWENLGYKTYSAPAISSWGPGRLDVTVRGIDNVLYHRGYDNCAWAPAWDSLGGGTYDAPSAVSWGESRIDIAIRGTDNVVYRKTFSDGVWSAWENMGNITYSGPAIISKEAGLLDIFTRGTDNSIQQRTYQ